MSAVFSLIPLAWKIGGAGALVGLLALVSGFAGCKAYDAGYDKAAALYTAQMATESAARALAVVEAVQGASDKLSAAQARADAKEAELIAAERTFAQERAAFNRRIDHAVKTAAATCAGLPADWVLAYNAALGAGSSTLPENAGAAAAPGSTAAAPGSVPGLSLGESLIGELVSPADILAHARDYGATCRRLSLQVEGWQQTYRNWNEARP